MQCGKGIFYRKETKVTKEDQAEFFTGGTERTEVLSDVHYAGEKMGKVSGREGATGNISNPGFHISKGRQRAPMSGVEGGGGPRLSPERGRGDFSGGQLDSPEVCATVSVGI